MMNDQKKPEISLLETQPLPVPKVDRQRRWGQHHLVLVVSLLVSASLLLFLVVAAWGATPASRKAQQAASATPAKPHTQQQVPTTQPTPIAQTALIASQVDSLLTNETTHQQFSGSVLIAQNDQVLSRLHHQAIYRHGASDLAAARQTARGGSSLLLP